MSSSMKKGGGAQGLHVSCGHCQRGIQSLHGMQLRVPHNNNNNSVQPRFWTQPDGMSKLDTDHQTDSHLVLVFCCWFFFSFFSIQDKEEEDLKKKAAGKLLKVPTVTQHAQQK